MSMFVVQVIVFQINGMVYGSINGMDSVTPFITIDEQLQ